MSLYVDIEKHLPEFHLKTSFEAGNEILSILGASGCGKSLTLKCIAGIETPDRGRIVLNGRVLFDSQKRINLPSRDRKVGYLFQNYALFPHMTVRENIACGLTSRDSTSADSWIDKFYLSGLEDHYPTQLSGGQQQRTALARMLASDPALIMLDEPFSALDDYLRWQMEQELRKTIRGFPGTALFVSHNRDEVYRMSDRIAVMGNGCLKTVQSKKELFHNPETLEAALLTGYKNISSVIYIDTHTFFASDWNITLTSSVPITQDTKYVGIPSDSLSVVSDASPGNSAVCKITDIIEDTLSVIILVSEKNNRNPGDRAQIRYEIPKEKAKNLRINDIFYLHFPKDQFLFFKDY